MVRVARAHTKHARTHIHTRAQSARQSTFPVFALEDVVQVPLTTRVECTVGAVPPNRSLPTAPHPRRVRARRLVSRRLATARSRRHYATRVRHLY